MTVISDITMDEERALYGSSDLLVKNCRFDGPADGESALKESANICIEHCYFNLRYPCWHVYGLSMEDCELTPNCRAALWYTQDAHIERTRLHGIKALRESKKVTVKDCDIDSPEFGWKLEDVRMERSKAKSEYFMLLTRQIYMQDLQLVGKYSFQYVEDAVLERCNLETKDAFWHARNVIVRDSVLRGEYLAWFSNGLTLERCTVIGTQPLCYCENLVLKDCRMIDTDLSFEKSQVQATSSTPVQSIKNPAAGKILVPSLGELIMDDPAARGEVIVGYDTKSEEVIGVMPQKKKSPKLDALK